MLLRNITGLAVCALIIVSAAAAGAGIPDLDLSTAVRATDDATVLSVMVLPNGQGFSFDNARGAGGVVTDATITLTLVDGLGAPIANFPFEDMWLESIDGGVVPCSGNAVADFNTNELGETIWQSPLFATGLSTSNVNVIINGDPLAGAGLPIHFNSADLVVDGIVNLSDVGAYADFVYGAYDYAADFNNDQVINLTDTGMFAGAMGAACP